MYQSLIRTGKKRTQQKEKHRVLTEAEDDQEYSIVRQLMGNGHVKVLCADNQERMGRIRGSMRHSRNKVLIEKGDLLLVSKRGDYDADKVDIIHKYRHDEANILLTSGSLPEVLARALTQSDNGALAGDNDDLIEFREPDLITI